MNNEVEKEAMRKARILTNAAYLLTDVCNTIIQNAESELKKAGMQLKYGEKYNFNRLKKQMKTAEVLSKQLAEPMYKIDLKNEACEDSDWFYKYMLLLIDRTGDNEELMQKVKNQLLEMPSRLEIY